MSPATFSAPGSIPGLSDAVVNLRGLRASDVQPMIEYAGEDQMHRWTSVPEPYTRTDADRFLAATADGWTRRAHYHFAIETDGRFAGIVDLRPHGAGLAEVGYGLAAWARGRGAMTRALRLVIPWGFREADVDLLHWRAQVGNWPSRRVAWAVGFRVERAVPGLLEHRGRRVDGWIGALRKGDPLRPVHPWFDPVSITGPGVQLREHRPGDVPRMVEACRDPVTQHWLSTLPDPYTELDGHEHLAQIRTEQAEGRAVYWAVADRTDDRLLGEMMVFVRDSTARHGEIGYWTHPDARGRGFTTEAVRLAARHALLPMEDGGLGLDRLLLRAAGGNRASQAVAVKSGFTRTGRDRGADRLRDGTVVDDVRFDLLAGELPPVR